MKTRTPLIWASAAVVTLVALLIWFAKHRPVEMGPHVSAESNRAPQSRETAPIEPQWASAPSPSEVSPPAAGVAAGTNIATPPGQSRAHQMLYALSNYNDMPILFYGKLEDQFGDAVPGATINFSVPFNTGYDVGVRRGQVTSDASGLFTVSGYRGKSLSAVPSKGGYALASTNGGGVYSQLWPEEERVHPDPNKPVVVRMWKLQGAEPLLAIDQHYDLRYTSAPVYFDLLAGKVVPSGGDVKMTVSQTLGVGTLANQGIWNVRVEAVNGGLMDSAGQGRTTYWAPAEGYQPGDSLIFPTNVAGLNRSFFVTSRNGQVHSKLGLSFRINNGADGQVYVSFTGVANTNGSRNWEGDPNTYKPQ